MSKKENGRISEYFSVGCRFFAFCKTIAERGKKKGKMEKKLTMVVDAVGIFVMGIFLCCNLVKGDVQEYRWQME